MARQVLENGVILPAEYSDDWYDDMTSNLTKLDDVIGSDSEKLSSADVGAAALSNSYNDLDNLPTIPTVNDATLTIQKNGVDVQTFTANASSNVTANITVPTKTSDLTNDSNFVDTSNSAVASGITSAKVTDYDTHIADTDIHVTASDKTTWNAVSSKANDSDVVHKSGNETVSGEKTFNDLNIIGYGTQYKGARNAYILPEFSAGYSGLAITTLGFPQTLKIGNFVLDANNKPTLDTSKAYIQIATGENNGVNACVLEPRNSASSSLGASSNKWSKIYGTEYYYGSNNVEFSTKFVTTDTNQTVSGAKTFSDNLTIYNSDDTQTPKGLVIRNAQWGMGESGGTTVSNIKFLDKNNAIPVSISASKGFYGQSFLRFSVRTKDSQNNTYSEEIYYNIDTSGNVEFRSWHDNSTSLGASIYKWQDVQTYKVNGVEPSSLSLPSGDASNFIDISSYFANTGTGDTNSYTASANGWIYLRLGDISSCQATVYDANNNRMWGQSSTGSVEQMTIPILKGQTLTTEWATTSSVIVDIARFIPCQGNV